MRRYLWAVAGACVGLAEPVQAQSVKEVLDGARLLGDWQTKCAEPVGKSNIRTRYFVMPSGEARLAYDTGPGSMPAVNRITSAKRLAPDRVGYTTENPDTGLRLEVEVLMKDGRIRVWSSKRPDGQYLVDKGIMTGNNRASPLQSRCK